jgi:hypothetical protein
MVDSIHYVIKNTHGSVFELGWRLGCTEHMACYEYDIQYILYVIENETVQAHTNTNTHTAESKGWMVF